jgi:hypothetical protein
LVGEKRTPQAIFKLEAAKQCKLKNPRVNTPGGQKLVRILLDIQHAQIGLRGIDLETQIDGFTQLKQCFIIVPIGVNDFFIADATDIIIGWHGRVGLCEADFVRTIELSDDFALVRI